VRELVEGLAATAREAKAAAEEARAAAEAAQDAVRGVAPADTATDGGTSATQPHALSVDLDLDAD